MTTVSSEGHHYTVYAAYQAPLAAGTPAGEVRSGSPTPVLD